MNKFFNPNSDIWKGFSFVLDVLVLSITWIIVSSLIFTSGLATTGLYYAVNNYLLKKEINPLAGFAKSVKQNLKIAILAEVIIVILAILVAWSMYISYQAMIQGIAMGRVILYCGIVISVFLIGYISYIFPTLATYKYGIKELFDICFKLSIMHLPITILFAIIYILSALLAYYFWISLFFTPAIVMIIQSKILNKIYLKHTN